MISEKNYSFYFESNIWQALRMKVIQTCLKMRTIWVVRNRFYTLRVIVNKSNLANLTRVGRSLMNTMNSSRPRILPWGTPEVAGRMLEPSPLTETSWNLEFRSGLNWDRRWYTILTENIVAMQMKACRTFHVIITWLLAIQIAVGPLIRLAFISFSIWL